MKLLFIKINSLIWIKHCYSLIGIASPIQFLAMNTTVENKINILSDMLSEFLGELVNRFINLFWLNSIECLLAIIYLVRKYNLFLTK